MTLKVINKINGKLKFLCRKNKFVIPELRRIHYNVLIQPHFDYACQLGTQIIPKNTNYAIAQYKLIIDKYKLCNANYGFVLD